MYVSPENWDVDFAFANFNLALFEWQRSCCRKWIVTLPRRRILVECLKILTQITIEDENPLAEREVFQKKINKRI